VKLSQVLFSQGFGARRECEGLIASGFVAIDGRVHDDPFEDIPVEQLVFRVRGEPWPYREKALIVMNKPAGHECSQKPKHHPSVYSLLPPPLRRRDVQAIGRLDEDTTGLLLLTDDGALIHRWTSPKHHVPKVYEVGCKHPVTDDQIRQLLGGVTLVDDPLPVRAASALATGAFSGQHEPSDGAELHGLRMTLTEGKYHQVKRMVAAVGNRVEALHRSGYGALQLPDDLAPGQWRWLDSPQVVVPAPNAEPPRASPR
jgi:16S rRNA pseudouridine516 synthase